MDPATAMCAWTPLQPCAHGPRYSRVRMCPTTAMCACAPLQPCAHMCPTTAVCACAPLQPCTPPHPSAIGPLTLFRWPSPPQPPYLTPLAPPPSPHTAGPLHPLLALLLLQVHGLRVCLFRISIRALPISMLQLLLLTQHIIPPNAAAAAAAASSTAVAAAAVADLLLHLRNRTPQDSWQTSPPCKRRPLGAVQI